VINISRNLFEIKLRL